ncbi:uncharacterized protein LOC110604988 isoform X2 [Manihot esculenta]|uniref:uncharacterized protein LOC110604988 isoform X2 n=1 Tax=Manihot esculenta TaxID=3983 RepID=UPI001CC42B7F|nr:uncharacterized protein LOC110604988 isoform X2 [Manihot esculenta]
MRRHGMRKTKTDIQATGELNYAKEDAFTPAQFPSSTQSLPPSSLIPVLPLILFSVSLCLLLIFEFSHRVFFLVLPFSFSICRILLLPLFDMEGNSLNFEPHLEVEGIGNLETRVSNSLPDNGGLESSTDFYNSAATIGLGTHEIPTPAENDARNNEKKGTKTSEKKLGKYFFYDSPLSEETGVWIPVSVPPMVENDHEEWSRGFHSNGGYFPEGDMGWNQYLGEEKDLTMWDVIVEMLLAANGKVRAIASGDIRSSNFSWISSHLLEQAWQEMAQTLTEVNFGNVTEILEAEPPKWLADSAASACMLCGVRFHPIMCSRHHCRFCGGIFCGECSKGRSLLPVKFRIADPQRVCDVCCVRLETVQPYLMDQVSHAAQLPTHDLTDLSTLRSWVNFPWGQTMEYEIYKAANTIQGYNKAGGELTDFVIVLRTNDAVKTFCSNAHVSLGAGLSAAVGIIGRAVEADLRAGDRGHAACYTYSCSKGAFVGCSLEGSIVTTRAKENSRFYGSQSISASDILLGCLPSPPAAAILYRALAELSQKLER